MIRIFFLICIIFCCNACIKKAHISGHLFKEDEMKALEQAKTKQDIEGILGSPTTVSDFGPETWYYITTKKETIAFLPDKILEQNIVAISFKQDQVDIISRYSEHDANQPHLVSEYTATRGNDINAAQQLFTNIGRFNGNKQPETATPRSGF